MIATLWPPQRARWHDCIEPLTTASNGPDSAEKKTHKSRVALSNATTRRQGAQGAQKGTRGVRGRPRVAQWGRFCEGEPNGAARNAELR